MIENIGPESVQGTNFPNIDKRYLFVYSATNELAYINVLCTHVSLRNLQFRSKWIYLYRCPISQYVYGVLRCGSFQLICQWSPVGHNSVQGD